MKISERERGGTVESRHEVIRSVYKFKAPSCILHIIYSVSQAILRRIFTAFYLKRVTCMFNWPIHAL